VPEVARQSDPLLEVSPFDRLYGLEVEECSDELVRASVQIREDLTQPLGLVHGGVYASIAEGIASLGTNRGVAADEQIGLGLANQSSFLRPLATGTIHAVARRRHRGRTTWIWDVEVTGDDGRPCALSRVTIAVRDRPERS
jgi:1,4-dihydroxy-2-naphthoyl-CoA hydrolase